MISVSVASPQEIVALEYQQLKAAAKAVFEGEGVPSAKVTLAFVDDPTIHGINKRHLDHDEPTDVITFPYSGKGAKKLEGEIVIGVEVAQRNAAERGHTVHVELCLYAIHGALHLCGYYDSTPRDRRLMREKENFYLKACGLPEVASDS
jgi:probable rRNA maturation factor